MRGAVGEAASRGAMVEVHGGALNELIEEVEGDVEAEAGVGEGDEDGVAVGSPAAV